MTPEEAENREERVAIMTAEGMSEEEAQAYCDTRPWLHGVRDQTHSQPDLIKVNPTH